MNYKLILQLHVHSNRSHDSSVSIEEYVKYLDENCFENELVVLAITDHNVVPLSTLASFKYSTKNVIVVPGIEWNIHKTVKQTLRRFASRKELITLGDQDDFSEFIRNKTRNTLTNDGEISNKISDDDILKYIQSHKDLTIIIPHPSHLFLEYFGKKQIRELYKTIIDNNPGHNFFVEEKTGSDPFPRIFYTFKGKYPILGSSDAHRIYGFFKTITLNSVVTSIQDYAGITAQWRASFENQDLALYKEVINIIPTYLTDYNHKIVIEKQLNLSILSLFGGIPAFIQRRFTDFPKRLFH